MTDPIVASRRSKEAPAIYDSNPYIEGDDRYRDVAWDEGFAAGLVQGRAEALDVERLRRVFHDEYEVQYEIGGCRHGNQHRKSWDCARRADEFAASLAALGGNPDD